MGNLREFLVVLSAVLLLAGCGSPQNSAESGAAPVKPPLFGPLIKLV